jgi:hypothetical protein
MKIVVVVTGELRLPVGDLIAEILRIGEPAVRSWVRIGHTGKGSEFPDGSATVAVVLEFGEEVDTVAAPSVAEVVPEIVVHSERGRIGSARS